LIMETVSYPLRIPAALMELAEMRAREEYVNKTTALKQLLYTGAEDYVLELLARGRISVGKAAELLGKTIYEMQGLMRERRIEAGATVEQHERAVRNARTFKKRR